MMREKRSWMACVAASALVGCGGGGGGASGDTSSASDYAVKAAFGRLLESGGSWTVNGTASDGHAYALAFAFAPLAPAPFPITGTTAARSMQTLSTKVDGVDLGNATETFYFDASSLQFIGIELDSGSCSAMTANTSAPTASKVGTSGPLFAENDYDTCVSGSSVGGTTTGTWSLEADSGVVLLCWTLVSPSPPQSQDAKVSYCFEVQSDGTLGARARFKLDVATSGSPFTLTARNF